MAWDKKWGENRKKKRAERRERGLCIQCGEKTNGIALCDRCNEKKVEALRSMRENATAAGICQNCFKNKTGGGFYKNGRLQLTMWCPGHWVVLMNITMPN